MNRYRFDYHEDTREFLVYLEHYDNSPPTLIGQASVAIAQRPEGLYAWADKQAALLGLESAKMHT